MALATHETCRHCKKSFRIGEAHHCLAQYVYEQQSLGGIATCPICGMAIPAGQLHACVDAPKFGERKTSYTYSDKWEKMLRESQRQRKEMPSTFPLAEYTFERYVDASDPFAEKLRVVAGPGIVSIERMGLAARRAEESTALIKIELTTRGVVVVGTEGDRVATHTISWQAMEKAKTNPMILAIEAVEAELENDE